MSKPIIKIDNLSKKYQIGSKESYYSLRENIANAFNFEKRKKKKEDFWALKNINLEVKQGEAVGIIGRNGAGKSTLLKVLSQITPPTTGKITMRGRVASLLEVGTGFHPELTGRENIFLNGAILGMTRTEIKRKFDEIVAFSEIEKFLDTPVKRYSSGMYVRLAFAVAAHLEPEILIVDEVLAVGDIQFQKKCLGKMDQIAKEKGRTVLFVSHNMSAVQNLCSQSILLENGSIRNIGKTNSIVTEYIKTMLSHSSGSHKFKTEIPGFIVEKIRVLSQPSFNDNLEFGIEIDTTIPKKDVTIELHIINSLMNRVMTGKTVVSNIATGRSSVNITIHKPQLPPGNYSLDISMHTHNTGFFYEKQILFFEILPGSLDDPFVIQRKDTLGAYPETNHVIKKL